MDLQTLEKNIKLKMYGCTESLLADAKWIHHNSVIFNGNAHKLTSSAKSLLLACKQEMREIEVCPDCYLHAHTVKESWFVEPCRRPHVLVWAKLKGFPFWPGKAMRIVNGNVDIRFFGAHDRAWVPLNLVYQLSSEMPAPLKTKKKTSFENSLDELEQHISKLRLKLGGFEYAPVRTPFDPEKLYLSPISKVSTGRRHSDAEQSSPIKGRTVTIVTSSWMRKLQAEGTTAIATGPSKSSPSKKKKGHKHHKSGTPKKENRNKGNLETAAAATPVVPKPKLSHEPSFKVSDPNKNPPLGVFEISNNMDIPKELNIQTETLVLNDFSASHLEKLKKIESTIERIKESFNDEEEDEEHVQNKDNLSADQVQKDSSDNNRTESAKKVISSSESTSNDDVPLSQLQKDISTRETESRSPACEVSSTTNNEQVTVTTPTFPTNVEEFAVPKKGSAFVMKLHQTIQSCKANLGLNNVGQSEESSSSDSEGESEDSDEDAGKGSSDNNSEVDAVDDHEDAAGDEVNSLKDDEKSDDEPCSMDTGASEKNLENVSSVSESDKEEESMDNMQLSEDRSDFGSDVEVLDVNNKQASQETSMGKSINRDSTEKHNFDGSNDSLPVTNVANSNTRQSPVAPRTPTETPTSSNSHTITAPPDITKYANKVIEIMTDLCKNVGTPESNVKGLEMEIGRINWLHEQEMKEIKHNTDLVLMEVRQSMEADKKRALAELKEKFEAEKKVLLAEKEKAVSETKKKQWCANCRKEAIYYCCWNTSYCDYKCQQEHWPSHVASCAQTQRAAVISDPQNDNLRPASNVVITQIQSNAGRARPRPNQNSFVGGDGVHVVYDSHSDQRQHVSQHNPPLLPPPMLNPPRPSHMQCFPQPRPSRTAQVLPQTSGASGGNNTVSLHYVSSLPSGLSNYQLIPQSIPLPRIAVPRLSQPTSVSPTAHPHLTRPPTTVVVSRPGMIPHAPSPTGAVRFAPRPNT